MRCLIAPHFFVLPMRQPAHEHQFAKILVLRDRPGNNIAVLKCQIGLRYSSSDSILNPFSEAETDETMLERR